MNPCPLFPRPAVRLAGLLLLLATFAGCTSTKNATSPVGVEYTGGALVVVEAAPFDQVWRASRAAVNDLGITELDSQRSELGGYIDGRTPDLKKVMLKLRPLDPNKTELHIRISTFGNQEFSRQIYAKIQLALAPAP